MGAPELVKKGGGRTYSNDMWAMGVALYIMTNYNMLPDFLKGFNGDIKAMYRHIGSLAENAELHVCRDLPCSRLDVLIKGLLTVNVRNRFNSAQALQAAI